MHRFGLQILIIAISVSTFKTQAADFRQEDKQLHLAATTGISSVTYGVSRGNGFSRTKSYLMAMGVATAAGLAKELSDPKFDKNDMEANLVGAGLGPMLFINYDF